MAGATGRWLVAALRRGSLTTAIGAAAGAMVLAGCLTALAGNEADAPMLPLLAALAAAGVAWITAFATHRSLGRVDPGIVALGVFLAFDAVVAASVFIVWTERAGAIHGRRRGPGDSPPPRSLPPGATTGRPVRWP